MLRTSICVALIAAVPLSVQADPQDDLEREIFSDANALVRIRADLELPVQKDIIGRCREAITEARAANVPASYELSGSVVGDSPYEGLPKSYKGDKGGASIRLSDADVVCDELARWMPLAEARRAVEEAYEALEWLKMINMATNHEENGPKLMASAKACKQAIVSLTGAQIEKIKVKRHGRTDHYVVPVGEIDEKYCEPLAKVAATFSANVKAARRADWDKAAKPYKEAGLTGDKLDLMVSLDGRAIYGVGGGELTSPKQKKSASLMFEVLTANDGTVTLRRYQFKGDKLVRTSSADYLRRPPGSAYR